MLSEFEIRIGDTKVKITVGGRSGRSSGGDSPTDPSSETASGGPEGGDSPTDPPSDTGSGPGSGGGCCCTPVVIGPIVVSGSSMPGEQGGDSPTDPPSDTASGAPGSGGSCCCAPVVIGPIVFTGCCSGQSTATSSTVQQICVPPPSIAAQGTAPSFVMQQQQETNWCWVATAVSVHAFLDPLPGGTFAPVSAQPTLATELLHQQNPAASLNCSIEHEAKSTKLCNQAERLDTALTINGNLRAGGFLKNSCLSFACLQGWLSMKFPVCARIVWRGGGAHFIALDACWVSPTGAQKVHVQDPNGAASVQDYQTLVDDLYGSGYWHDTYLTTK